MASNNQPRQQQDRPLPKFGEWDVNDPASAEGFTVIFAKARDDKKTNASGRATSQRRDNNNNKGQEAPTEIRGLKRNGSAVSEEQTTTTSRKAESKSTF
ncbi:unnamed protein product, partial [Thlaspi arvense]